MATIRLDHRLSRGAALRVGGQGTCKYTGILCNLIFFVSLLIDRSGDPVSPDRLVREAARPASWAGVGLVLSLFLKCPCVPMVDSRKCYFSGIFSRDGA